jgi:lipopolysaccharide heptosyltransferase II
MTALVRLPNWVGDTLLGLPALEGLIASAPGEISLAGRPLLLSLTRHLAPVALRVPLHSGHSPRAFLKNVAALRAARPSRALLTTPSFSSALECWAAGFRERLGWPEQGRGFLLTERVRRYPRGSFHLCEELKALARRAGAEAFPEIPALPVDARASEEAERFLNARLGVTAGESAPLIAVCPGGRYGPAKQWPLARHAALAQILSRGGAIHGLIVGSAGEGASGEAIAAAAPGWLSAAGQGSILFAAEVLRRADVAVCNDSGAMHLAAAVGTPVVALFGPTDPRWTGPLGPRHRILRAACDCSPCFRRTCPVDDSTPCMERIEPEEVARCVREILAGPQAALRPAIFLDRDGTLIEHEPYLHDPARVRLMPGAAAALRQARSEGWLLVLVSNQSGVARGFYGHEAVARVHAALLDALAREGAVIDRCYYCPHHPDHTGPCACRKPAPGMLRQAAQELGIDLARSVMIGDAVEDICAGERAGCRAVLVRRGGDTGEHVPGGSEIPAGTQIAGDLGEALSLLGRPE